MPEHTRSVDRKQVPSPVHPMFPCIGFRFGCKLMKLKHEFIGGELLSQIHVSFEESLAPNRIDPPHHPCIKRSIFALYLGLQRGFALERHFVMPRKPFVVQRFLPIDMNSEISVCKDII